MPDVVPPQLNELADSNYALDALRRYVTSPEGLRAGKLPTERALSLQYGIGRHALRRALEVLEAEGLIWRRQGAGTFIGQRPHPSDSHIAALIPKTNYNDVMEVRLRIEPQLAQLAAMRATPSDVARMRELAQRFAEAEDAEGRELWDGALHRQIALSARNELFLSIFDTINRVRHDKTWQTLRQISVNKAKRMGAVDGHHTLIVDAIDQGNPQAAAQAMYEHMLDIQVRLIEITCIDPALDRMNGEGFTLRTSQ